MSVSDQGAVDELHFARAGRLIRLVESWGDPFEETTVLPAVASVIFLLMLDRHTISQTAALWLVVAVQGFAGFWLGLSLRYALMFRVMLRGVGVGLAVGVGGILTLPQTEPVANLKVLAAAGVISMYLYMGGFSFGNATSSVCLSTEANWQKMGPSRALITAIMRSAWNGARSIFLQVVAGLIVWIIIQHFSSIKDFLQALPGGP